MLDNPLVIKRPKIIKSLQDQLAARKKTHDEEQAKKVAKQKQAVANFNALVAEYPGWVMSRLTIAFGEFKDGEATLDYVEKQWGEDSVKSYDDKVKSVDFPGHPVIEKWIRLLEMSDNTTLEIKPTDEIYPLL